MLCISGEEARKNKTCGHTHMLTPLGLKFDWDPLMDGMWVGIGFHQPLWTFRIKVLSQAVKHLWLI